MHYRELIAWQRSIDLTLLVYQATRYFPKEELNGLQSQLRRASVSIASNIAEGKGRASRGEFRQFVGIARGSFLELETQLFIAKRLGYLTDEAYQLLEEKSTELGRILNGLFSSLKANS